LRSEITREFISSRMIVDALLTPTFMICPGIPATEFLGQCSVTFPSATGRN
jgi:hypothetical protein